MTSLLQQKTRCGGTSAMMCCALLVVATTMYGYTLGDTWTSPRHLSSLAGSNACRVWLADYVVATLQFRKGHDTPQSKLQQRPLGVWTSSEVPLQVGSQVWYTTDFNDSAPLYVSELTRSACGANSITLSGADSKLLRLSLVDSVHRSECPDHHDLYCVNASKCGTVETCVSALFRQTLESKLSHTHTISQQGDTLILASPDGNHLRCRLLLFALPNHVVAEVIAWTGQLYHRVFENQRYVAMVWSNESLEIMRAELDEYSCTVTNKRLVALH